MKKWIFKITCLIVSGAMATLQAQDIKPSKSQRWKVQKAKADSLLQQAGMSPPSISPGVSIGGKSLKASDANTLFSETLPDLGLKIKEYRKQEKARRLQKKRYHTEYEGLSIVKQVTTTGSGDRLTQIEFHVLKQNQFPRQYDGIDVYWYDTRNRVITKSVIKDKEAALILHGPYKRYVSGNLVEEGNYYLGTKDGRWETYDGDYHLLDKTKWWHGLPSESLITYYDSAHTKICEVVPIQYGKRKGDYLKYYDGGQLMVKGQYDNDTPIGTWNEYYQFKRQRKKVIRYPRYWYEGSEGILISEWDDKGKLIYERPKEAASASDTEN
ncbi:MAG: toxin-antitoxin system YwqK family antitoxin [Runella sp.]